MSLTTVAELRTALGVGTLYADATLQEVCDAADNVLLPFLWKNQQYIIAHGNQGTVGTLYFDQPIRDYFYVGQSVTISGAGTKYNGTNKTYGAHRATEWNRCSRRDRSATPTGPKGRFVRALYRTAPMPPMAKLKKMVQQNKQSKYFQLEGTHTRIKMMSGQ